MEINSRTDYLYSSLNKTVWSTEPIPPPTSPPHLFWKTDDFWNIYYNGAFSFLFLALPPLNRALSSQLCAANQQYLHSLPDVWRLKKPQVYFCQTPFSSNFKRLHSQKRNQDEQGSLALCSLKLYFERGIWCQVSFFFFPPQSFPRSHPQVFYLQTRKSYFASQLWTVTTKSWRLVQSLGLKRLESVLRLAEGILHWFGGNVRPRGLKGQSCYWWHGWWVVLTVWGMCEQNSLVLGGAVQAGRG